MNKLLSYTLILIFACVCNNLLAQNVDEPRFQKSFKVYTNATVFHSWTPNGFSRLLSSGPLSLALQLENQKGHFHEFELSGMGYSTGLGDPGGRSSQFIFTGRYEKAFQLFSSQNGRLKLHLGYSLSPGYSYQRNVFITSNDERLVQFSRFTSFDLAVVPRLTYKISDRLSLDINMPISLNRWSYSSTSFSNNARPGVEWTFAPQIQTRVGISYRF